MKGRKLGYPCPTCGREMNTWDERVAKALGYLKYQVCEDCICKEYSIDKNDLRDKMENFFGMRPCKGI